MYLINLQCYQAFISLSGVEKASMYERTCSYMYTWMGESNSERLVNTKRNMDTVPRLPIHPFNLPRQLKNIIIIKIKTVMFFIFYKNKYT